MKHGLDTWCNVCKIEVTYDDVSDEVSCRCSVVLTLDAVVDDEEFGDGWNSAYVLSALQKYRE